MKITSVILFCLSLLITTIVFAHGDAQPQAVDASTLPQLGDEWLESNPYRGLETAIAIGKTGYASNCARCHGLGAVSGGFLLTCDYWRPVMRR